MALLVLLGFALACEIALGLLTLGLCLAACQLVAPSTTPERAA